MLFSVVEIYRQGVRLSREEIVAAAPIIGLLTVSDWPGQGVRRRTSRVARLHHPEVSYFPELLLPLFDPVLVRMNNVGFLLEGRGNHSSEGKVTEYMQGWWVRAVNNR